MLVRVLNDGTRVYLFRDGKSARRFCRMFDGVINGRCHGMFMCLIF